MTNPSESPSPDRNAANLVPLLTVVLVFAVFLISSLRVISYGFLPGDDALRHAAKAVSGKPWSEILLLRPEITLDPHEGWHWFLTQVHKVMGGNTEDLVVFSLLFLFLCYTATPLFFVRRPEAWLAAVLVVTLSTANGYGRLLMGRPFLISMTVVLFLCLNWYKFRSPRRHPVVVALLAVGVAVSTWSHCAWYLWPLPLLCFFLSRQWKAGITVGVSMAVGIILGGALSGHPVGFLSQAVGIAHSSVGSRAVSRQLVAEFASSKGEWNLVIGVLLLLLWRKQRGTWKTSRIHNPVFYLAVAGWILGLKTLRFWADWGIPAITVWMTWEFQDVMRRSHDSFSWRRIAAGAVLGSAFFFIFTADLGGRWTNKLTTEYLDASNPQTRAWLPGPGGIFYNDDMSLFYDTFFQNPHGDWRYVLGFEASLMPPEDLATFRKIQWNYGTDEAYEPWIRKLRPIDRIVTIRARSDKPNIPELEWNYAATGIWIGRLPQDNRTEPDAPGPRNQ